MDAQHYRFSGEQTLISPALVYYKDQIRQNIQKSIAQAGGAQHLWPHVKTHKMAEVIRLQLDMGICRFKCATIAEAEMCAQVGAPTLLLAYPLVGPNISRFLQLCAAYPETTFYAIGDALSPLQALSAAAAAQNRVVPVLVDVNMGMDRTGVVLSQLAAFYREAAELPGLQLCGLHCYDGHRTEHTPEERNREAYPVEEEIHTIVETLQAEGLHCDTVIFGGTPSMPCYIPRLSRYTHGYLSPGTLFVNDAGYMEKFPDLDYTPGAAILTRVVSHPLPGHFTIDLGYKGISADPKGANGTLLLPHAVECFQSEEHWAFRMEAGYADQCPPIGTELFVIPTHICPTTALYPAATVVENGQIIGTWAVTARNRKLSI